MPRFPILLFLYSSTILFCMDVDKSVKKGTQVPSLLELSLKALLKPDPKTFGHRLHGYGHLLEDIVLQHFGRCRPEWGMSKLLTYAQLVETLCLKSELEKAATFLAESFDVELDSGFRSVAVKVQLFNALESLPAVRNAISTQRAQMSLKKKEGVCR
ncbi:MAG: hypothetical protein Q8Q25_01000 [bacterium]|nr:hypothetical protein [bacterium]